MSAEDTHKRKYKRKAGRVVRPKMNWLVPALFRPIQAAAAIVGITAGATAIVRQV